MYNHFFLVGGGFAFAAFLKIDGFLQFWNYKKWFDVLKWTYYSL